MDITTQQIKDSIIRAKSDPIFAEQLKTRLDTGKFDVQLSEIGLRRGAQGLMKIDETMMPVQAEKQARIEQGLPVSVREDRAEPTRAGDIARGIIKVPIKAALSIPAAVRGEKGVTVKSKYLGDTSDIVSDLAKKTDVIVERVKSGDITLGGGIARAVGEAGLSTLDVASLVPAGALGKAGVTGASKVATTGAEQIAKQTGKIVSKGKGFIEPISAVTESVSSTIGSALRRGKEGLAGSIQQAKQTAKLPVAEKALVRSGLDNEVIDFIKTSSKESAPIYEKIVSVAKKGGMRNGTAAKEVVGKEIIEKVAKPVIRMRDIVGKKIGKIVEKLPTAKESIADSVDEFTNLLNEVGVKVGKNGKLTAGRGAVTGDLPAYQNMFNRIKQGSASQRELHKIRSAVFKEFDLAKARQNPFSGDAERVAEQFRSILGKKITNKDYLKYSQKYSEIMKPLQDFVKYIGYKGDIEKIGTQNLKVAEIAGRLLGNASARPKEVLETITALAEKTGKGKLSKDILDQVRFSDLMEDFYGIGQTKSLAGQVSRGTKAGVESATENLLESGASGGVTGLISSTVKGVLGKTKAEQQRALELFIKSLNKK